MQLDDENDGLALLLVDFSHNRNWQKQIIPVPFTKKCNGSTGQPTLATLAALSF